MTDQYSMLFSPVEIGPVAVRNRIYHAPVTTNFVDRETGFPGDSMVDYYVERAKGGVGLIIQGAVDVAPESDFWPVPHTRMHDEAIVPHLRRITAGVHQHGARIFIEIFHIGQASNTRTHGAPAHAPSGIPSLVAGATPKCMEREDIEGAVRSFGLAVTHAVAAGYDGVELHATHGYLLEEFLSPFYNKRSDEYGGTLENRMRFLLQVIDCCREAAGQRIALGIRLVGDELLPGGLTLEDTTRIAARIAESGKIDFVDVDIGSHQNYHVTMSPMYGAPGFNLPCAAAIREAVDPLPVLCAPGRLVDPGAAERILRDGHADLIGLGRTLISDPQWPLKVREGRPDDIRQCVFCNQYTMGNLYKGLPVSCIQNPAVGREGIWGSGSLRAAPASRKVVVVGGGPAGMEVARLARLRGHRVTLVERHKEVGGQVLLAAALPRRSEMEGVVRWLGLQLARSGVEVVLGTEVTPALLQSLEPDVVVVATGASFDGSGISGVTSQPIAGSDLPGVTLTPEMVLRGEGTLGPSIVIADSQGDVVAPALAELLAGRGSRVTIVTSFPMVGPKLAEEMNLPYVYSKLYELGVTMVPNAWVTEIRSGSVHVCNLYAPHQVQQVAADTVVVVTMRRPHQDLYSALKGTIRELHRVGDCVAPGDIGTAMLSAHKLGRDL
ncbi:MAG: mycofactocin system FadH/OYE family oxidoreductase 2 [Gammaproteobacteria bacterium]|nr:mycofactocin system FadH/OYE family oxidoreductase 2 [Gammaproteobacteria bacterium]